MPAGGPDKCPTSLKDHLQTRPCLRQLLRLALQTLRSLCRYRYTGCLLSLEDVDLTNTNLYGASLFNARLNQVNLTDAYLEDADLYAAILTTTTSFETTTGSPYYYGNTRLPSDLDPVAKGWTLTHDCDFT